MDPWRPASRELEITLTCCRRPWTEAVADAVRTLALQGVDWSTVIAITKRHRISVLVAAGLARSNVQLPDAADAELRALGAAAKRRALILANETCVLDRELRGHAIGPLFVKGASLGVLAYGRALLKESEDIDVLVQPEAVEPAERVLASLGFERRIPDPRCAPHHEALWRRIEKESVWHRQSDDVVIDLHHRLANYGGMLADLTAKSPSQPVTLPGGRTIQTLRTPELILYLMTHGALCGWSRLKWLADLAALLAEQSAGPIEQIYESSRSHGVERCAGQALLLCSRLFATPFPPHLLQSLRDDSGLARLEAAAMMSFSGEAAVREVKELPHIGRQLLAARLRLSRSWRFKYDVGRELWVRHEDRLRHPLPHGWSFLYHVLRIPGAIWRILRRSWSGAGHRARRRDERVTQVRGAL